jgi:hypothetical protein
MLAYECKDFLKISPKMCRNLKGFPQSNKNALLRGRFTFTHIFSFSIPEWLPAAKAGVSSME